MKARICSKLWLSSQVERYGPYTAPYTDPLSGAEIRTVTSLKWDDLRP